MAHTPSHPARRRWARILASALVLAVWPAASRADSISIVGNPASSTSGLGNFSATLIYTDIDATHATLEVRNLTNTSPAANGGYLTAFVLNNPGSITGISEGNSFGNFQLIPVGGPYNNDGVNGAPFGQFDFGASTFKDFEGGGPPSAGLGVGQSESFLFNLVGTSLNTLNVMSFVNAKSVGPGDGMGHQFFVARFRGFKNVGSDKVPGDPGDGGGGGGGGGPGPGPGPAVPEPSTLLLLGLGIGALSRGSRWLGRRQ
jgi:hypothetical protein